MAGSFYLLINNNAKVKLNGGSIGINPTTFQLPENGFILPGKYQCLIEALELYNEIISSPASSEISMPGRFTGNTSQILMNLLVTKIFEEGIISFF